MKCLLITLHISHPHTPAVSTVNEHEWCWFYNENKKVTLDWQSPHFGVKRDVKQEMKCRWNRSFSKNMKMENHHWQLQLVATLKLMFTLLMGLRIHWLYPQRRSKTSSKKECPEYDTWLHLMGRHQSWDPEECGILLLCHYSKILFGSHLWVKQIDLK